MADAIITTLKITASITFASIFFVAIMALLNLVVSLVFSTLVGELLALFSMCLPFKATIVFGSVSFILSGIIAFLVARKIFTLSNELLKASS